MEAWPAVENAAGLTHPAADTVELADWAYSEGQHPQLASLERPAAPAEGYRPIGKRTTGKDGRPRLLWALHRLIRLLTSL